MIAGRWRRVEQVAQGISECWFEEGAQGIFLRTSGEGKRAYRGPGSLIRCQPSKGLFLSSQATAVIDKWGGVELTMKGIELTSQHWKATGFACDFVNGVPCDNIRDRDG